MQKKEIENTENIRQVLTDEINAIRQGKSNPARGNAVANLIGKMLQSVKLDIEVHRYVSAKDVKTLSTQLVGPKKTLKQ